MSKTLKCKAIDNLTEVSIQLSKAQSTIDHIEWLLSPERASHPSMELEDELKTELMMLKGQTLGNLMVDLRRAIVDLELEMAR